MSLITECYHCGHHSYIISDNDIDIDTVYCTRCKQSKPKPCIIMDDKLPPMQHGTEYDAKIILRHIANVLQKGATGLQLSKLANIFWPECDWHIRRMERNTIWGFNKKK